MSLDPEYIKYFNKFHKDRMSSISDTLYCENCNTNIVDFIVDENKLIYSCGGKGKCGHQFIITLPVYVNYFDEITKLTSQYNITKDLKFLHKLKN